MGFHPPYTCELPSQHIHTLMMQINYEQCEVDKRRLIFDCRIGEDNYRFVYDDWSEDTSEKTFTRNGKKTAGKVLDAYKHRVFAYFPVVHTYIDGETTEMDSWVVIDRRYEHNHSYDVYYEGKHYLIGTETSV